MNLSMLLVKNMLRSKLHCQKVFNLIIFSHKDTREEEAFVSKEEEGRTKASVDLGTQPRVG